TPLIRRVSPQAVGIAPTKACLDLDVAALCPSQFLKSLLKRCHSGLSFPIVRHCHQQPDPPHPLRLLRARRERPRCPAANHRHELAPVHSLTSSAMASSPGGKLTPNTLAVLRLITNSNLVDWMTGRSAGFSPLRIRPVYTPAWRYASVMLVP